MQLLVAAFFAMARFANPVELEACLQSFVPFEQGSARLNDRAKLALDGGAPNILRMLMTGNWVVIEARADPAGPSSYNLKLSQRRAETVREALIARGVPRHSIFIEALGETQSSDVSSEIDRSANVLVYMPKAEWKRRYGNVLC